MEKKNKIKVYALVASVFLILVSIIAYTYSYYSAVVKYNELTETNLQSNKLGLKFTGVKEIKLSDMVPGDSIVKTFTVENISNRAVDYNIFMQGTLNEFGPDLVYTLADNNGQVVAQTALPETNTEKTYIATNVSIAKGETKTYTLTIEFLYNATEPQNTLQGKEFKTTLGIDADPATYVTSASSVTYSSPYTDCEDVSCAVNDLYSKIVGE